MDAPAGHEPIVRTVEVRLPPSEAFELFPTGMGEWWPLDRHSIAVDSHGGRVTSTGLTFENHEGGRAGVLSAYLTATDTRGHGLPRDDAI